MIIKIFDVAHGFCAHIVTDNGKSVLVDCGQNEETGFQPSSYISKKGYTSIEQLIVSNYDEDHISDLPNLITQLPVRTLYRNPSISADALEGLKSEAGPIQPGMRSLLELISQYSRSTALPSELDGAVLHFFWNTYPAFEDTNNLSLVTFLHYGNIHAIFPGDLEVDGWSELLENAIFRNELGRVNIFVASHHGRESGYCPDVFDHCHPALVIISDESIQYDTQDTPYAQHAQGIPWGEGRRYVLTTRSDGMITISEESGQGATIRTAR
jgi:beta-lactamase superfamily II metal-dependent hydrolase